MSSVIDFGARGDGQADDSDAIQHAIDDSEGWVEFPPGDYLITRTIVIDLTKRERIGITGAGGTAKIIMAAAGPAFHILGTHGGTADPATFKPNVWSRERMPTIQDIEIEGRHAEADGIELTGTMQSVISQVALRELRHGIRLTRRNRNPVISACQIYHNRGAGVFLDGVNLHQINIMGNHISYNRLGGIRIERSEIRNLQITGNDIEYNTDRTHKLGNEPTAEIYVDTTAAGATVNEIAITSNTIQARPSPAGANIRIIESAESKDRPPGLWTISGNIIGSQTNNVHLTHCYGVTISGNSIYSCQAHNVLLESCRQIVVSGNNLRRHTSAAYTGMRLVDSTDCVVSGCQVLDDSADGQASGKSLLEITGCRRLNISGCQFVGGVPYGVDIEASHDLNFCGCSMLDDREPTSMKAAVRVARGSKRVLITGCHIGRGTADALLIDQGSEVTSHANLLD